MAQSRGKIIGFGAAANIVQPLRRRFEDLGFTYEETTQTEWLSHVSPTHDLLMVVVEESEGQRVDEEVLRRISAVYPGVPVVWAAPVRVPRPLGPDLLLESPAAVNEKFLGKIDSLLIPRVYDTGLMHSLSLAVSKVFATFLRTSATADRSFLMAPNETLGEAFAYVSFTSEPATGYVAVSANKNFLVNAHRKVVGEFTASANQVAQSLAGEVANQITGMLKAYIVRRGTSVSIGPPRGAVNASRKLVGFPYRHCAIVQTFMVDNQPVYVEIGLEKYHPDFFTQGAPSVCQQPGEMVFL